MILVSYGAATILKRAFIGKLPISAEGCRGFSYRASRFSISHDSGTHVGGDQWVVQVQYWASISLEVQGPPLFCRSD